MITQIETCLPEEYSVLSQVARMLPGNAYSPVHPFTSLVININAQTQGHRDTGDQEFCLVMPVGTYTGGGLALVEPGLILDLRPGDFAIFRSCDVTHFNMNYRGKRASLVLHTDKEMNAWLERRNNWDHNLTLQSYTN